MAKREKKTEPTRNQPQTYGNEQTQRDKFKRDFDPQENFYLFLPITLQQHQPPQCARSHQPFQIRTVNSSTHFSSGPFQMLHRKQHNTSMIVHRRGTHQQQLLSNQCIFVSVICTRTTHKSLSERGHFSISFMIGSWSYLFLPQEIQKLHTKPKPASSSADLLVNVQIFSSTQLSVSVPPDILAQRKWKGPKHDKTDQRAIWAVNMNKTPRFRHGY